MATLEIAGYSLDYLTPAGRIAVLQDIDLSIAPGEVMGLVGESGSGKSSLAAAIMRALPGNAQEAAAGRISLSGTELRGLPERAMAGLRGGRIAMVFQDPATALNPSMTLGAQAAEVLVAHRGMGWDQAAAEVQRLFAQVGLRDPAAMARRYPHEASGGEKQRVVIATAFACQPELILCDEPTTALDVITARQILDLFAEMQRQTGAAALWISHDLAIVSRIAARVAVLQRGRIVEQGSAEAIFQRPAEDYTRCLLAAVPRPEHRLAPPAPPPDGPPLVAARGVTVRYGRPSLFGRDKGVVGAGDVSLEIRPGEILGVVGESGSGKSTLARALTGLAGFEGQLSFDGRPLASLKLDRDYRRQVQIVFQHPDASLNPRHRVGEILARPLKLYGDPKRRPLPRAIAELLEAVRLPASYADRYPHQLSGGEKQRVAIARAFAPEPRLVICDEVTSALDVSVQASVVELLMELHRRSGAAYMFITHDLNLVRQIAHRIVVMRAGALVETIGIDALAAGPPAHAYTRALLDAVPAIRA